MKWPSSNGLAVPITEMGYEMVLPERRKTSQHHLFYERRMYTKRYQQVFRGLVSNVYTMYIHDHQDLHERYSAPVMPKDIQMIDVVEEYLSLNGVIDVVKEHRTSEIYQIESGTWQNIKSQYGSGHGIQEVFQSRTLRTT